MMLGLPGDSEEKCTATARDFVDIGPDFVRIYPTLVVKETGLEEELKAGRYRPFSLEECIDITKKLMVIFRLNNIGVIRVGLQATEDIQLGMDVLAGPYHPAFRELVRSRMVRDYLDYILSDKLESISSSPLDGLLEPSTKHKDVKSYLKDDKKNLTIRANNRDISMIVGNNRSNRKYVNDKYGVRFKTVASPDLLEKLIVELDGVQVDRVTYKDLYRVLAKLYRLV